MTDIEKVEEAYKSYMAGNRAPWVERTLAAAYCSQIVSLRAESESRRLALIEKSNECAAEWKRAEGFEGQVQTLRADLERVRKDRDDVVRERGLAEAEVKGLREELKQRNGSDGPSWNRLEVAEKLAREASEKHAFIVKEAKMLNQLREDAESANALLRRQLAEMTDCRDHVLSHHKKLESQLTILRRELDEAKAQAEKLKQGFRQTEVNELYAALAQERNASKDMIEKMACLDGELAEAVRVKDAWELSAAQMCRDKEFYRDLVWKIGEGFGEAAYTSDDGSKQQDVLALKVPELVEKLRCQHRAFCYIAADHERRAIERAEKAEAALAEQGRRMEELRKETIQRLVPVAQYMESCGEDGCDHAENFCTPEHAIAVQLRTLIARWGAAEKGLTSAEGGEARP